MFNKKIIIIVFLVLLFIALLTWLYIESSKPKPGTKIDDLGRNHIPVGQKVKYNSNPPTSGDHFEDWIRSGVYDEVKEDGLLIHSLEHGYVIISYNCDHKEVSSSWTRAVFAHEEDFEASISAQTSSPSAQLSENFSSQSCQGLVKQLTEVFNKKGAKKLIVLPRPNLDTRIALTAWNYIDKFDALDKARIEKFIDAHLNNGPERTME